MHWVTPWQAEGQQVRLVRPLLGVRRRMIAQYLATHALSWCEDTSNQAMQFHRNRLRHVILPQLAALNPNIVETLTRTAEILGGDAARIDRLDRETLQTLLLEPSPETLNTGALPIARVAPMVRVVLHLERGRGVPHRDRRAGTCCQRGGLDIDRRLGGLRGGGAARGDGAPVRRTGVTAVGPFAERGRR